SNGGTAPSKSIGSVTVTGGGGGGGVKPSGINRRYQAFAEFAASAYRKYSTSSLTSTISYVRTPVKYPMKPLPLMLRNCLSPSSLIDQPRLSPGVKGAV